MTEDELFRKAFLFLYAAAGENIGFDIKPVDPEEKENQQDQSA